MSNKKFYRCGIHHLPKRCEVVYGHSFRNSKKCYFQATIINTVQLRQQKMESKKYSYCSIDKLKYIYATLFVLCYNTWLYTYYMCVRYVYINENKRCLLTDHFRIVIVFNMHILWVILSLHTILRNQRNIWYNI